MVVGEMSVEVFDVGAHNDLEEFAWRSHIATLLFALDICNMQAPLFMGLSAMVQILPFVTDTKGRVDG